MKVTIEQLSRLFDRYGENLDVKYFDDILVKESCYLSTDLVLKSHLPRLAENGISEIEVFFTPTLYDHLTQDFPVEFRKPFGRCTMSEMDRKLEELRDANTQSKRKRYLRWIGEIYGVDKNLGKRIILLRNNEPVDFKKWNNLKREVDRNHYFHYRNSEVAVIIFVDLKVARQKEYIERFKINTDLISLIVSKSQEPGNVIAPDFIATEDVISVTEPGMLLEEYIRSNARLIIIGEKLDDFYKRALLQVRNYDRFVRLLVVPSIDHSNCHDFFRQVNLVYNNDRWL